MTPVPGYGLDLRPRSTWSAGLGPVGPLSSEAPGDVHLLLVHHSASPNGYAQSEVPAILQGFFRYHTGPEKGWPDLAYNFLVDRFGVVWEGRTGSLDGPVKGDATGGSQGFSQICCFIGDHASEPPTDAARAAMAGVLASLADRYGVPTGPGVTTTFVSRGSNKLPAGQLVTLPTIAGHRQASETTCPGDAAFHWVEAELPAAVTARRANHAGAPSSSTSTSTTASGDPTPAPTSTVEGQPEGKASTTSTTLSASRGSTVDSTASTDATGSSPSGDGDTGRDWLVPLTGASGLVAAVVASVIGIRRRRI